jgi:predicted transcriptional regulator
LEEFGELLFALSSSDRMKLLSELQGGDVRLTDLSERLSATAQETSKHLARLVDSRVIEKSPEGAYRLTSFGKLVMETLPSLKFVSQNRKYFLTHDVSFLPTEFILRLGDLSEHVFIHHVTNVLTECQHLLGIAEDYFLWTIDQPLPWVLLKPLPENMRAKCIMPADIAAESYKQAKNVLGIGSEVRFANGVRVGLAVNEKMGGIVFPDAEGNIDFASGFIGYSKSFQKWCLDLFNHMWDEANSKWPAGLAEAKVEPGKKTKP